MIAPAMRGHQRSHEQGHQRHRASGSVWKTTTTAATARRIATAAKARLRERRRFGRGARPRRLRRAPERRGLLIDEQGVHELACRVARPGAPHHLEVPVRDVVAIGAHGPPNAVRPPAERAHRGDGRARRQRDEAGDQRRLAATDEQHAVDPEQRAVERHLRPRRSDRSPRRTVRRRTPGTSRCPPCGRARESPRGARPRTDIAVHDVTLDELGIVAVQTTMLQPFSASARPSAWQAAFACPTWCRPSSTSTVRVDAADDGDGRGHRGEPMGKPRDAGARTRRWRRGRRRRRSGGRRSACRPAGRRRGRRGSTPPGGR